ncbi:hydroxysqualene dehydroxylase HpnE [Comamonas humi]
MAAARRIAIVGGGWAGMAAAVGLASTSHVTVFEAARVFGGRARAVQLPQPDGSTLTLDNGQHILIGAYAECRRLMALVGVDENRAFVRLPLTLVHPDGSGIALPDLAPPWDALWGIARARGWPWRERFALLRRAARWQRQGFACASTATVAGLCAGLPPRLQAEFIEPLCISALNTPMEQASGAVFLRVLRDSLFAGRGGSHFWLPAADLGALFPSTAAAWLQARGHDCRTGTRVAQLTARPQGGWLVDGEAFDAVVLATPAPEAARLAREATAQAAPWADAAARLQHTAITTVYAQADRATRLPRPVLALRSQRGWPAQFVFDRGQLGGPAGLLAFVISTSDGPQAELQAQVLAQAQAQLGLPLEPVQTIVEKRATFACTPGLQRPGMAIAPGLLACGDYVDGPYPATLEGAVLSGSAVAQLVSK